MVFYCNVYYIVVLCWALHYLFSSFTSGELPWSTCDNWWNTEHCISPEHGNNGTNADNNGTTTDSVVEYWEYVHS